MFWSTPVSGGVLINCKHGPHFFTRIWEWVDRREWSGVPREMLFARDVFALRTGLRGLRGVRGLRGLRWPFKSVRLKLCLCATSH